MDFDYCEKHLASLSNKILLWQCSEKQREKLIQNLSFPKLLSFSSGFKKNECSIYYHYRIFLHQKHNINLILASCRWKKGLIPVARLIIFYNCSWLFISSKASENWYLLILFNVGLVIPEIETSVVFCF